MARGAANRKQTDKQTNKHHIHTHDTPHRNENEHGIKFKSREMQQNVNYFNWVVVAVQSKGSEKRGKLSQSISSQERPSLSCNVEIS